ncbi:RabGAP/TBC, partial [Rhizodiscina lignyota]
ERDNRHDSAVQDSPPTTTSKAAMSSTVPRPESPSTVPEIVVSDDAQNEAPKPFEPITTNIPTGSLDNLFDPENVEFSKRGSMLLGGSRANGKVRHAPSFRSLGERTPRPRPAAQSARLTALSAGARTLSTDEDMLSKRVRSMYEHGDESAADWVSILEEEEGVDGEGEQQDSANQNADAQPSRAYPASVASTMGRSDARRISFIQREPREAAGGMEDWQDVEGEEVDRYGFIKKVASRGSSGHSNVPPQNADSGMHRVTTSLQLAADSPRRQRTIRRAVSNATKSTHRRRGSRQSTAQRASVYSSASGSTTTTATTSRLRYVSNRLPHNRQRRWMEEAGDMLTAPPGLEQTIPDQENENAELQLALKKKEWEREEKWRKMGKVAKRDAHGGGMVFDFDTRNGKLISRTWKGIPDRWRATAWWAFLANSAKKAGTGNPGGESEEELIEAFHDAQEKSSADDVQIDVDMPRTINSHIMFRRRYRGGQRALFRVLHAMSLYLPDPGYVQGMAAIAATLLCYYDEEKTFVMMTRLWRLRGMGHIYSNGFEGLMETLEAFEKDWLVDGEVARKLKELGIISMTYATRWYLTLFNYSIPFPAQLRVWDVFMLLGDVDLDVLHAVSAALIDGMREILLLDADFENAMKVLTSWIPIRDEDLLMKVSRAEYRVKRKK